MAASLEGVREWFRERHEKLDLFDETQTAKQANPLYTLGGMLYYFWLVTVVSGIALMLWYEPTTTGAFQSIVSIQDEIGKRLTLFGATVTLPVAIGGLIRGLHKYGADALIITIILRIYRMYFAGEYKKPGELSWMIGFAGLILAMISGITGYVLIWNQRAFWAVKVVLTTAVYLDELPLIGGLGIGKATAYIFLGGPAIGQGALTRLYAVHFLISILLLIVVEVFFYRTRRRRINLSLGMVGLYTLMLVAVSVALPAEMGRLANPNRTPLPILSDWYFLALYQFVKYTPPIWAALGPPLLIVYGMIVPFLDRSRERAARERPFFTVVGIMALVYFIVFTALILFNIAVIRREPPFFLGLTAVILSVGLVLELQARRRRAARPAAPAAARPRPAPAGAPASQ